MPAKSEAQRKMFAAALAQKRSGEPAPKGAPSRGLEGLSEQQLADFAAKPKGKKLPEHKR
jgi:hypothetical protein